MSIATCAGATVVVMPPAKTGRPLPVGQLAGTYLAADLASRSARARGERVVTTAGVDVHQGSVLTRAERAGVDAEKLAAAFRDEFVDALDAARIRYDVFLDPLSPAYQRGVTTLAANLTEAGRIPLRKRTMLVCADCGARTAVEGCAHCGGQPRPLNVAVPVLSIEDYRQDLTEIWLRACLPDRARQVVTHQLERRLPDVPIAYPGTWGLEGTGPHEGLRLDAYAELGLSTAYGVAQSLRPGSVGLDETAQAWSEAAALWHFNTFDDCFYFTIFWPALYLACGMPPETLGGAQVTDPPNSTTSATDFLHDTNVDIARLYLAWAPTGQPPSTYRDFETYVRPLLDGARSPTVPAALAQPDLERATAALHPATFNPPQAVRAALTTPTNQLLSILTGR
ncbi:class I tRNA ligase family protein [Kribbella sp. CWNU-51]